MMYNITSSDKMLCEYDRMQIGMLSVLRQDDKGEVYDFYNDDWNDLSGGILCEKAHGQRTDPAGTAQDCQRQGNIKKIL